MKKIVKMGIYMFGFLTLFFMFANVKVAALTRNEAVAELKDKDLKSFSIYVIESTDQKGKVDLKTLIENQLKEDVPLSDNEEPVPSNIKVLYKDFEHNRLVDVRKAVTSAVNDKTNDTKIIVLNVDSSEGSWLLYCGLFWSEKKPWANAINSSGAVIVMPAGSKKNLANSCLSDQHNLVIVGDKDNIGNQGYGSTLDLVASSDNGSPLVPVVADIALMFNTRPEVGALEMVENISFNRAPGANGIKKYASHNKFSGRGELDFSALYANLEYKKLSLDIKGKVHGYVQVIFDSDNISSIPGMEDFNGGHTATSAALALLGDEYVKKGIKGRIIIRRNNSKITLDYFKINGQSVKSDWKDITVGKETFKGQEYIIDEVSGPILVEVGFYRYKIEKLFWW